MRVSQQWTEPPRSGAVRPRTPVRRCTRSRRRAGGSCCFWSAGRTRPPLGRRHRGGGGLRPYRRLPPACCTPPWLRRGTGAGPGTPAGRRGSGSDGRRPGRRTARPSRRTATFLGSDGFPVGRPSVGGVLRRPDRRGSRPCCHGAAAPGAGGPAALLGVLAVGRRASGQQLPWALTYLLVVGALVLAYRSSVWVLGVVWELDRAPRRPGPARRRRGAAALRPGPARRPRPQPVRDRGQERAGRPAGPPRPTRRSSGCWRSARSPRTPCARCARWSAGLPHADLDVELAGARSLLRSAGIAVRVIGDGDGLPPECPGRARLGGPRGDHQRAAPQRAAAVTIDLPPDPTSSGPWRGFGSRTTASAPTGPAAGRPASAPDCRPAATAGRLGGDLTAGGHPDGRFVVEAAAAARPPPATGDRELVP